MDRARSTGEKSSITTDLAGVTAIMGKVPTRELERAICRVQFAKDVGIDRLLLAMKYIAAKLTSETQVDLQAFRGTYDSWY